MLDLQALQRQQSIVFYQGETQGKPLNSKTRHLLIDYIDKKIRLTELVQAKMMRLANAPEEAKQYAAKAHQLDEELKRLAKLLLRRPEPCIQNAPQAIQSKESLEAIKLRFERGQFKPSDLSYLQRDIKCQAQ